MTRWTLWPVAAVLVLTNATTLRAQSNAGPVFTDQPFSCGFAYGIHDGDEIDWRFEASEEDAGAIVTMTVEGVPPGASADPPPPVSGNPVAVTFSWAPTHEQRGRYPLRFVATDQDGRSAVCELSLVVRSRTRVAAHAIVAEIDDEGASIVAPEFSARLTEVATGAPLEGFAIWFRLSGALGLCVDVTDADGVARCGNPLAWATAVRALSVYAWFEGGDFYTLAFDRAPLARVMGTAIP